MAIFRTGGDVQLAGRQFDQGGGRVQQEITRFGLHPVAGLRIHVVEHRRCDRAGRPEHIQRHATFDRRGRAPATGDPACIEERRAERKRQFRVVLEGKDCLVLVGTCLRHVHAPRDRSARDIEQAIEGEMPATRIHGLLPAARAVFEKPPLESGNRIIEGVVDVVGRDVEPSGGPAATERPEPDPRWRQLLGRLPPVEQDVTRYRNVWRQFETSLRKERLALKWRLQVVVWSKIDAPVGRPIEGTEITRRRAGAPSDTGVGPIVVTKHHERDASRAERQARDGYRRDRPVAGHDRIVLGVLDAERDVPAITTASITEFGIAADAIAMVGFAVIGTQLGALEIPAGDDVDDAGDGIGAVDRRRAILQDFDPFDQGQRNRGKIHRAVQPADPALAVHQHQRAVGTEAAQVDQFAGVGAVVDVAVLGLPVDDDVLHDHADVGEAGAQQVVAFHHQQRVLGLQVDAADVAAGDVDRPERLRRPGGIGTLLLRRVAAVVRWVGCERIPAAAQHQQ